MEKSMAAEWGQFFVNGVLIYGTIFSIFCLYLDKQVVPKASKLWTHGLRVLTLYLIVPMLIASIFNEMISSSSIASRATFSGDFGASLSLVILSWLVLGTTSLKTTETP